MRTRATPLLALLACALLSGCAGLYPAPGDSGGRRAAKIATRVVIGIPTLGISEAIIGRNAVHRARLAEVREIAARYEEARQDLAAARTDEEWERAHLRLQLAAEDVHRERARLRDEARRELAVEPFSSIHTVRRQMDERILPPVDPAPWSDEPEWLRGPH